ncbi:MAG: hypothetical protein ACEQSX_17000, partial [Baekduiaceae bacterium]
MRSRPRSRRGLALAFLAAAGVVTAGLTLPGAAQTQGSFVAPAGWPVTGLPGADVLPIGASPLSAPDEVWGIGAASRGDVATPDKAIRHVLLRQRGDGGWEHVSRIEREDGESASSAPLMGAGPGVARVTPRGGVAFVSAGSELYVRRPNGRVRAVREPDASVLPTGTRLFGTDRATIAAVDESAATSVFVAPVGRVEDHVLYYDGTDWEAETIVVPRRPPP